MNRKRMKKSIENRARRSEELNDIIDRMPMTFGKWVALSVICFAALFLLFGWIIKYPDTVTGEIKLNAQNPTIRLVANSTGNLILYRQKSQENVKSGEYIAAIQNTASTKDMQKLIELVERIEVDNLSIIEMKDEFPAKISLGEANPPYYAFLTALRALCDYKERNTFEKQKENIKNGIKWKEEIVTEVIKAQNASKERESTDYKWFSRYKSLRNEDKVISEFETDQMRDNYLTSALEVQSIKKEIASTRMQIADAYYQLENLTIEQSEKERELQMNLLATFHSLKTNIALWEQKYIFKAPFDGKVEFLKFIADGQFTQAGESVFGIIPEENHIYGQMLLPANGAGKVKNGSKVIIKLENYPYMEYGYIEGRVESISLVTQTQQIKEGTSVETYLINVELPKGLTTNYNKVLNFKYEIGGTADIVVKDRRLIERLFDNLKYRVNN